MKRPGIPSLHAAGALLAAAFILALPMRSSAAGEQRFTSPEEAIKALTTAATAGDTNTLRQIFGPEGHELVSPDAVEAANDFAAFQKRLAVKIDPVHQSDAKIELSLGTDGWPFPIPLVKDGAHWFFDTDAGREEILNRRIGRDELGAIQVCHAYVDAQREYASRDRTGGGVLEYARHLRSTSGTHDGLYWPQGDSAELSPLGPLVAQARVEGYRHEKKILNGDESPYHGYFFKILTRQGKHAPAGKFNYVINGHLLAGFGLVSWPDQWGSTGVMTFIVNQQGKVYQKNLGPKTGVIAAAMTTFDPDETWTLVKE
jgi:hypothetical protein